MKNAHLWICSEKDGYAVGQGDATIALVLGNSDIPRSARPDDYDARTTALCFKAAPDLLRAAKAILALRKNIEYQAFGVSDEMNLLQKAVDRAEGVF